MPICEYNHGDVRVLGATAAGEETYFVLPEFNVGFEFGRAPRDVVATDHIFLSHGHMDHAAGLAYYFSQRMFIDNEPGHAYMPEPLVEPARELLKIWGEIDGNEPPAHLHAARPNEDIQVRRGLVMRPFEVNHPARRRGRPTVHSLGYALIDVRQKLRDEFIGMTGPQIVDLKGQGVEITRRVEVPLVAYCGDTARGDFLELDHVRTARVLLIECTFLEADHRDRARAGRHMHLDDLREIVPKLENERILLVHLTRRTLIHDARRMLREAFGDQFDERIVLFADQRKRRGRSNKPSDAPAAT